jgi:hypothetical protein
MKSGYDTIAKPAPPKPIIILPDEPRLTAPVIPSEDLSIPPVKVSLNLSFTDLQKDPGKKRLLDELRSGIGHRVDLGCADTAVALDRLRQSLTKQDIHLMIDQDAQERLTLRLKSNFAFYVDDLTAEETLAILHLMNTEDQKNGPRRKTAPAFDNLIVNELSRPDRLELSNRLGIDPTKLSVQPKTPLAADIHQPLSAKTEQQVVQSLKNSSRTTQNTVLKPGERVAVAVTCDTQRPRSPSAEIKACLESRPNPRSGTLQMLVILRGH